VAVIRRAAGPILGLLRRTAYAVNLLLFLAALLAIALSANYFAHRPDLRIQFDATKTRAYSLSEQTVRLLSDLEGQWTIALIVVEDATEAAVRRQIDEVLKRYQQAGRNISIVRVDPTDPGTLVEYENILARLRMLEADRIEAYEQALDAGEDAFAALQLFAQQQAAQIEQALTQTTPDDPRRVEIQQRLGLLDLLAREGGQVLEAVSGARGISDAQPIPDYETARSILAEALSQWGDELYDMARIYDQWRQVGDGGSVLALWAASVLDDYERMSRRLAAAADPLAQLPPLEMARIGRQLAGGEAAVVIGPDRAAVIPSAQLFPKMNLRAVGESAVAFEARFGGEQVISAAIRSLLVEQMPMVVFVHNEASSMLRSNAQNADVLGVATLLDRNRFTVREWSVGNTERPVGEAGQPVVWVVVPPARRQGLQPDQSELALMRAADRLIAEGETVMLNVNPSRLPRYGQPDPWQSVAEPFNLRPDTGSAIFEAVTVGDGEAYEPGQVVRRFETDHPICGAAHGQQAYFPLSVALEVVDPARTQVHHVPIALVQPKPRRWLETDWAGKLTGPGEVVIGEPFDDPLPIMIAAERADPIESGVQRFVLVGSAAWLRTYVADALTPIGAGRAALSNPGNQELMLASVEWLAGMDELIAPSPVSQQVARLDGLEGSAAVLWRLITVLGPPVGVLLLGVIVWLVRRI
jgi:hypothetical protein